MPTIQDSGAILTSIGEDLADNNAGLISALDVRHNMEDTVASIPHIVSLSDTKNTYYFRNDVLVSGDANSIDGGAADKKFITEGGIQFPNTPVVHADLDNNTQVEPFPGVGRLDHGQLKASSLQDDDHEQYLIRTGLRGMTGNFWTYNSNGPHWIGPSGNNNEGIQFTYDSDDKVIANVKNRFVYADGSTNSDINGSGTAKGLARAWCHFDASGTPEGLPVVKSSFNIDAIERVASGVIKLTFTSGTFGDNNYVAIGNSNANTAASTYDTFDVNTVGLMLRQGDDMNTLRSIHFVIRSDDNDYVDAELNDFVAYGLGPNVIADTSPTATNIGG
jgi:hypothetical protein